MRRFLFFLILIALVGCQAELQNQPTDNGGMEMKFNFDNVVEFLQQTLDIDTRFARDIAYALDDAGMSNMIIRVEALGTERPHSFLEIESQDGKIYHLNTSGGRVYHVKDAETGETLWGIINELDVD